MGIPRSCTEAIHNQFATQLNNSVLTFFNVEDIHLSKHINYIPLCAKTITLLNSIITCSETHVNERPIWKQKSISCDD